MVELLVAVVVAALAYYLLVLAGLPALVGILAAVLILLVAVRGRVGL